MSQSQIPDWPTAPCRRDTDIYNMIKVKQQDLFLVKKIAELETN